MDLLQGRGWWMERQACRECLLGLPVLPVLPKRSEREQKVLWAVAE